MIYQGVNLFRLLAALLVIQLHCLPVGYRGLPIEPNWSILFGTADRCAVPFFFVASGFFLRTPSSLHASIVLKPLKRLLPIYLSWVILYDAFFLLVPPPADLGWHVKLSDIYTGGIAFQLWFLPVLGASQVLVQTSRLLLGRLATFVLVLAIAAFGLFWGAYYDALHLPGTVHHGRAYSGPLLVFAGTWIAERRIVLTAHIAAGCVIAAYLLAVGEDYLIAAIAHVPAQNNEFTVGTTLLGVTAFLLASAPNLNAGSQMSAYFSKLSLGVYCVHAAFFWLLVPVVGNATAREWMLLSALVSACSIALIAMILPIPYLRRLSG